MRLGLSGAGATSPPARARKPLSSPAALLQSLRLFPGTPCTPEPPALLDVVHLGCVTPFLSLRDLHSLRLCGKDYQWAALPSTLSLFKTSLPPSFPGKAFSALGSNLLSLSLHRVTFASSHDFLALAKGCPHVQRLSLVDVGTVEGAWAPDAAAHACAAFMKHLIELKLHTSESHGSTHEVSQFAAFMPRLSAWPRLQKLTLFIKLNGEAAASLTQWLESGSTLPLDTWRPVDLEGAGAGAEPAPSPSTPGGVLPGSSRRLLKIKMSTSLVTGPGGLDVLTAVGRHPFLQRLTLVRPEGTGEPLRKVHAVAIGIAMGTNRRLASVHLRRCGIWADVLASLLPPKPVPQLTSLKIDGSSIGYLSGTFLSEALDSLIDRMPNLASLHLGNNSISGAQAEALAESIKRHGGLPHLESFTIGSNDLGNAGCAALLGVMPPGLRCAYLHGVDVDDEIVPAVADLLDRCPHLWGVGLNGNALTDVGAKDLATALRNRPSLRDVGLTLSGMTDIGVEYLASALKGQSIRFCFLYTQGFKAASLVSQAGMEKLRACGDKTLVVATHSLSRHLKHA